MSGKILMIDDEPDQIMMVEERLRAHGFEFDSATNSEEGLNKANETKPDVILLDVGLKPEKSFDLCKDIKKDPVLKDVPVVIFSAHTAKTFKNKCDEAGADACIGKPYESNELVSKLKSLVKKDQN